MDLGRGCALITGTAGGWIMLTGVEATHGNS